MGGAARPAAGAGARPQGRPHAPFYPRHRRAVRRRAGGRCGRALGAARAAWRLAGHGGAPGVAALEAVAAGGQPRRGGGAPRGRGAAPAARRPRARPAPGRLAGAAPASRARRLRPGQNGGRVRGARACRAEGGHRGIAARLPRGAGKGERFRPLPPSAAPALARPGRPGAAASDAARDAGRRRAGALPAGDHGRSARCAFAAPRGAGQHAPGRAGAGSQRDAVLRQDETFGPVRIPPARRPRQQPSPPAARPRRAPRRGRVPPTCRVP